MTETKTHEVPANVIEALARCLLPSIQDFFESEEGQREFAEWQSRQTTKSTVEEVRKLPLAS